MTSVVPDEGARDATRAWAALAADAAAAIDLAALVAGEPGRGDAFAHTVAGIYFDFAKLAATTGTLGRLDDLAAAAGFDAARAALFAGDVVNRSEERAATHPAERGSGRV